MNRIIERRVIKEADYMLVSKLTLRELAKVFKVSKSTIHTDLTVRLKKLDKEKFELTQDILKEHLDERHIRGGEITKLRFSKKKE